MPNWVYIYRYSLLLSLIGIMYAFNLGIDMMEYDATQYASISKEMSATGQYLQVHYRGEDYLDKPPLLFWLSSGGIALFGNNNFGYKLPSMLILLMGLWATWQFARLWHDARTGWIAMLMLATTQAFHLMTHDVRTDGLLTSFVILSAWWISLFLKKGNFGHLLLAGISIGCAMLAKGPLGLFIPGIAIGAHLVFSGQWKQIFQQHWLVLLVPVLVLLAPMCYGLYMQFDLHPEKEVYGLKGPSGLKFYFWTQSFGRITGESTWDNQTPWYYFLQTILWDMQPWLIFFVPAFVYKIKRWWHRNKAPKEGTEWITLFGFLMPFIALSFSHYKLPHYLFPLFPFAAIMTADYIATCAGTIPGWLEKIQLGIVHVLILGGLLVMTWVFPGAPLWLYAVIIMLYALMWWWRRRITDPAERLILPSFTGILIFQLILSAHFYPRLMAYQSTSQAGQFIEAYPEKEVFWLHKYGHAMEYYADRPVPYASGIHDTDYTGKWIFVAADSLAGIPPHKVVHAFDDFSVTKLNWKFLNPQTREQKVKKMLLVEILDRK